MFKYLGLQFHLPSFQAFLDHFICPVFSFMFLMTCQSWLKISSFEVVFFSMQPRWLIVS